MEAVMLSRLSNTTMDHLRPSIRSPRYERRAVTTGIVQLGVGAFHRAHQAVYTDDILARDPSWGIVAAYLRSPDALLHAWAIWRPKLDGIGELGPPDCGFDRAV